MTLESILQNHVLWSGFVAWMLAQILKVPLDAIRKRHWNWALFFSAGGMPSSHSSLVVSTALAVGLYSGFDTPLFAVAMAITMVVVYDAMGVRRQSGMQAKRINLLVEEVLKGHPINEKHLLEAVGHTPLEALGGVILGLVVTFGLWLIWR